MIAVGTQAGKVLVYNVLGLLVHEIVVDMPVRALEWVGDMSAPSTLLTRRSCLLSTPRSVSKKSAHDTDEVEDDPIKGTITLAWPTARSGKVHASELDQKSTVSFSRRTQSLGLIRHLPDVSQSSNWTEYLITPSFEVDMPSLAQSETMMSGALPIPLRPTTAIDSTGDQKTINTAKGQTRWQSRIAKGPIVSTRPVRQNRASEASCCRLRRSTSSSRAFFTPPSTRFPSVRKGKSTDVIAARTIESQPDIHETGHVPLRSSSDNSSISVEYGQGNNDKPVARSTGRLNLAKVKMSRPAAATTDHPVRSGTPEKKSSSSLRNISGSYDSIPASDTMLNHLTVQGNVVKQSRVMNKRRLASISPAPVTATSSSHDSSSSLYSRSKPRLFRNHLKALDGGADTATPLYTPARSPRRSFSFVGGLHKIEAIAEQRYVVAKKSEFGTDGKGSEISRLRSDHEALKKNISDLRVEFLALKDVLLRTESHRRWLECVS